MRYTKRAATLLVAFILALAVIPAMAQTTIMTTGGTTYIDTPDRPTITCITSGGVKYCD